MSEQQALSIIQQLQKALANIRRIENELSSVDVTQNGVISRLLGNIEFSAHVAQRRGAEHV